MGIVAAANPPANASATGAPPRRFIRRLGEPASVQPQVGLPSRLKIPAIHVDAAVEDVGKTPDGAMDVPKDFNNTAWYELGARPGEQGNAVVAGHVDSTTGPAVFWDLHTLASGDQIIVVGDDGVERTFVVTESAVYARADVPLERIFGTTTERHLNLITCDATSIFNPSKGEYADNLVVYARAA
ncbi:MAG: class F sortase [Thermomicrobia bacterium]|nr:class F sortase [Thermomicrobia bacterium]